MHKTCKYDQVTNENALIIYSTGNQIRISLTESETTSFKITSGDKTNNFPLVVGDNFESKDECLDIIKNLLLKIIDVGSKVFSSHDINFLSQESLDKLIAQLSENNFATLAD